jgi:hypothetical protein
MSSRSASRRRLGVLVAAVAAVAVTLGVNAALGAGTPDRFAGALSGPAEPVVMDTADVEFHPAEVGQTPFTDEQLHGAFTDFVDLVGQVGANAALVDASRELGPEEVLAVLKAGGLRAQSLPAARELVTDAFTGDELAIDTMRGVLFWWGAGSADLPGGWRLAEDPLRSYTLEAARLTPVVEPSGPALLAEAYTDLKLDVVDERGTRKTVTLSRYTAALLVTATTTTEQTAPGAGRLQLERVYGNWHLLDPDGALLDNPYSRPDEYPMGLAIGAKVEPLTPEQQKAYQDYLNGQ